MREWITGKHGPLNRSRQLENGLRPLPFADFHKFPLHQAAQIQTDVLLIYYETRIRETAFSKRRRQSAKLSVSVRSGISILRKTHIPKGSYGTYVNTLRHTYFRFMILKNVGEGMKKAVSGRQVWQDMGAKWYSAISWNDRQEAFSQMVKGCFFNAIYAFDCLWRPYL